ncbi:hypothetical protein EBT31_13895, partial [bacterium]|nr:hypothetical protein [bacterium]
ERYYQTGEITQLRRLAAAKGVIAEVYLETPSVPFVCRHENAVKYAIGKFWTVLCGDELGRALKEDLVRDVGRMAVYQIGPLFSDYVRHWYKAREKAKASGKPHEDLLAKMMMNSLYGKFFGPGDYILGNREVQSGTKSNAKKVGHELIEQDEFSGLNYQITHGPREGVIGQRVTIRRNPDRWKLHTETNGWVEPFKLFTPRLPVEPPPLLSI